MNAINELAKLVKLMPEQARKRVDVYNEKDIEEFIAVHMVSTANKVDEGTKWERNAYYFVIKQHETLESYLTIYLFDEEIEDYVATVADELLVSEALSFIKSMCGLKGEG